MKCRRKNQGCFGERGDAGDKEGPWESGALLRWDEGSCPLAHYSVPKRVQGDSLCWNVKQQCRNGESLTEQWRNSKIQFYPGILKRS